MQTRKTIAYINLIQQLRLLYCLVLYEMVQSSFTFQRHSNDMIMSLADDVWDSDKMVLNHFSHR